MPMMRCAHCWCLCNLVVYAYPMLLLRHAALRPYLTEKKKDNVAAQVTKMKAAAAGKKGSSSSKVGRCELNPG